MTKNIKRGGSGLKVLLVDDDIDIVENNAEYLGKKGYEILMAYDGAAAMAAAREADIIVLDVGLPDTDGFSLAEKLSDITAAPVLFLTARSDESAIERCFQAGSDYMKKPYSIKELSLRIESILARRTDGDYIDIPPFLIYTPAMSLTLAGRAIRLTPTEFSLLIMLVKSRGRTVRYEQLFETVWGSTGFSVSVVAQHVSSLKRKMESESGLRLIKTVRGEGYFFSAQPAASSGDCDA